MKKLMIILFCAMLMRADGQVNCPVFPRPKKEKIQLKGGEIQLSNFVNTFIGYEFRRTRFGILSSGFGLSKAINKFVFRFDFGGAKDFTNHYETSYWAVSSGYYLQSSKKSKLRIEATLHRMADERVIYFPTIQMVSTRNGKFLFGDFNYGVGYNQKSIYIQIGFRWGVFI